MLGVRLGFVLFGIFWGTWAVAALDIQEFLGLSDAGLGFLVAATVVGTSVANVVGGTFAERRGAPRATWIALAVWGALVLAVSAIGAPTGWMVAFLAVVAAGGMFDVVLNIASTGALQDRPGPLLRVHASYNVGTIIGATLTGAALAAIGTWRWSFAIVGLASLVLAHRIRIGAVAIPDVTSGEHVSVRDAAAELRRSGLVGLAVVFALGAMVEGGIGTFGVLYLRDRLDVAVLAGAGAYVAGQALATTTRFSLGGEWFARSGFASTRQRRLAGGRAARSGTAPIDGALPEAAGRHLGGTRPARAGLAVAGVGLALEGATDLPAVAAVGLAVASVGAATYWPLLSAVANRASDRPGLAVGGMSAAGYLGFLAGPTVVGAIAEGAGLRAGVLALAATGAAAAAIPLGAVARRVVDLAPAAPSRR